MNYIFKIFYRLNLTKLIYILDRRYKKNNLLKDNEGKNIVFCGPITPWGTLHQRPQNFAKALAKSGYNVTYCIEPYNLKQEVDSKIFGFEKLAKGLQLLSSAKDWHKYLSKVDYIYTCYPWQLNELKRIKELYPTAIHIHDVFDDMEIFSNKAKDVKDYNELIDIADRCIYSADKIKPNKDDNNLIYTPNGCDIEHFFSDDKAPILGYVGAIDTWFDFSLVEEMAESLPKSTFYLAGICNDKVKDKLDVLVKKNRNVIYIGKVDYLTVPSLVRNFDYALIPFIINDITLATSPIKMFEYLAANCNVISTSLPEVRKYNESVYIINSAQDAIDIVSSNVSINASVRLNTVKNSSWESRLLNVFK